MKKSSICLLSGLLSAVLINASVYAQSLPKVEATGATLIEFETGRVLWDKNGTTPLPMASTTKIMTAILTLEKGNLEDIVTVSRKASLAPKVRMNLQPGEKIRLKDLLYALMLQSSNDAAVAIAEHIGGSVEEFCRLMTEKAAAIGAKDTVFETPNGLDKGEHHSTAQDLALISRYAMSNPAFVELINTPNATAKSDRTTYTIINKNRLLHEYNGANGIKTGFTGKAGHCFVGSAKRDDMQLISVVLASGWGEKGKEQKWRDTKAILNYGFDNFKFYDIVKEGADAGSIAVRRAREESVKCYIAEGLRLPLSADEADCIRIDITLPDQITAPVTAGNPIGLAEVFIKGELYAQIEVRASDSIKRHDFETYFRKIFDAWTGMGTNG